MAVQLHLLLQSGRPLDLNCQMCLDRRLFTAVLELGSNVSLLNPADFPKVQVQPKTLLVTCIHGDIHHVLTTHVLIRVPRDTWLLTLG